MLSLRCYLGFSLVAGSRGCSLVAVGELLIAVASGAVELGCADLSGCGGTWAQQLWFQALEPRCNGDAAWAQLLCSMWGLPGSGIELLSPALAAEFFTTEPPEKPSTDF